MERYNNFLAKHDIKVWDEDLQRYVKCITVYKRVFYGDLKGAGRFYSLGKFQTLKSHLRKTFLLDNEVSTEMDYSCLQPRFLYTMNGIRLVEGWDAYDIPDLRHLCTSTDQEFRSFMKEVYLCILFSTDKKLAIKGIQSKANKRKDINVPNNKVCDMIVETVLVHNEEVRHEFFKDCLWAKLQNMDSRLTEYIIKRFTDLGKVCLGWHDSYVVCKSDRELLKSTMEDSWRSLFGLDMNCKIKLEF